MLRCNLRDPRDGAGAICVWVVASPCSVRCCSTRWRCPMSSKSVKKKEDEFKNSYIAKWAYQTHSATPTLDYLSASWSLFSPASTLIYWFFVCIKFITLKLCMYVVGRTAAVYAQCTSGVSCTEASERLISSSVRMSGNYELTCIHMNSIKWN